MKTIFLSGQLTVLAYFAVSGHISICCCVHWNIPIIRRRHQCSQLMQTLAKWLEYSLDKQT